MPKRSNDFQRLVFLIQKALEDRFDVRESEYLLDRTTGARREVDVVIRAKAGAHQLVIGLECTALKRRASVEWVEKMRGKHENLTDKLILVSARGFYPEAVKKADRLGIDTHSLDEFLGDPAQLSRYFDRFVMTRTDLYTPTCQLIFSDSPEGAELDDPVLYNAEGMAVGTVNDVWRKLNRDPEFLKAVDKLGADGVQHAGIELQVHSGTHIRARDGRKIGMLRMIIPTDISQYATEVPLEHKTFAGRHVAHGPVGERMPGQKVVIVERGDGTLSVLHDFGGDDVRRIG